MFKGHPPLHVVVLDDQYYMFGPKTFRTKILAIYLKGLGGPNEEVPDGDYTFNLERRGLYLEFLLLPMTE